MSSKGRSQQQMVKWCDSFNLYHISGKEKNSLGLEGLFKSHKNRLSFKCAAYSYTPAVCLSSQISLSLCLWAAVSLCHTNLTICNLRQTWGGNQRKVVLDLHNLGISLWAEETNVKKKMTLKLMRDQIRFALLCNKNTGFECSVQNHTEKVWLST